MENIQPVDDYSCLNHEYVSREDALRALQDYIRRRTYQLPMPDDLENFILNGLQNQFEEGAVGWHDDVGRPKSEIPFSIALLAWYCFHFDERFKGRTLQGDSDTAARYEQISEYLKKVLSPDRTPPSGLGASSIKRMVRNFRNHGFKEKTNPYSSLTQEQAREWWLDYARIFCRDELKLDQAKAEEVALAIVAKWEKGQKV